MQQGPGVAQVAIARAERRCQVPLLERPAEPVALGPADVETRRTARVLPMHQALVCPACGASDPGPSDAAGFGACAYCGVKFRLDASGRAHAVPAAPSSRSPGLLLGVGALGVLALSVALVFVVLRSEPDPEPWTAVMPLQPSDGPATPPGDPVTPLSSTSLAAAETPTPAPVPATATFAEHSRRTAIDGSLWILGLVTNTSPFPLGKVEVIAVLRDSAGTEITTANGYSKRDVLAPTESSPAQLLVKDPPESCSVTYEVVAKEPSYLPERAEGLRVEAAPPTATDYGAWEAQGKVFNDGREPARFVKIEVQAWDADDQLVGLSEGYAKAGSLAPGASARWKTLGMQTAAKPARFELVVDGRP